MFNVGLKLENQKLKSQLAALERVKSTLEHEMIAIQLDADGTLKSLNEQFEIALGYNASVLAGQDFSVLLPPDLANDPHQQRAVGAIKKGQHFSGTLRLLGQHD